MKQRQRQKEKRKKVFGWIFRIALIIGIILLLVQIYRCSTEEYTLELLGDNPQVINQGDDYKEKGYRFVDKDGKQVSKKLHNKLAKDVRIKGVSAINTMKIGEYSVEYHYRKQVETRIVRVKVPENKKSTPVKKEDKSTSDDGEEDSDSDAALDSSEKQSDGNAKEIAKNSSGNNVKSDDKSDSIGSKKPDDKKPGSNESGNKKPNKPEEDKNEEDKNDGDDDKNDDDKPTTPSKPEDQTPDVSGLSLNDSTVVYNGKTYSIKVGGKCPKDVTVSYTYNGKPASGAIDAGKYAVEAEIKYKNKVLRNMKATLTILKGNYDRDKFIFNSITVNHDGNEHSIFVDAASLQDGVRVDRYEGNGVKDIGIHTVKCYLVGDSKNYNPIEPLTAQITIKGTYDISEALKTFGDKSVTYTGSSYSITLDESKLPTDVTVSYTYNGKPASGATEAGEYIVEASFKGNGLYNPIPSVRVTLTIKKGTYSITGVTLPKQTKQYQKGVSQTLEIVGSLPPDVTPIYTYEGDDPNHILPGRYNVSVRFVGDSKNYNPIGLTLNAVLTIEGEVDDGEDPSTDPDKPDIDNPGNTDNTDVTNPDNSDINNPDGTEGDKDVTDPDESDIGNPDGTEGDKDVTDPDESDIGNPDGTEPVPVLETPEKTDVVENSEAEADAAVKKAAEEAAAKKAAEEAAAKKAAEEKKAAEAAAKKAAEEAAAKKAAEEAAAKKAAEEKKAAELAAKKAAEVAEAEVAKSEE